MCFPQCLGVCISVGVPQAAVDVGLFFDVETCWAIKPSCVAWSAPSVRCCYLRSNSALWPFPWQHTTTTTPPPPAFIPFLRHQNIATGTLTLIQIFHGHLPWNDGGLERKGLENSAQRRRKKCGCNIREWECNIILNQNAAIPAQYFKTCLLLMPSCWVYNINASYGNVKLCKVHIWKKGNYKHTYIYIHMKVSQVNVGAQHPQREGLFFLVMRVHCDQSCSCCCITSCDARSLFP